jgi:hypothetical protein
MSVLSSDDRFANRRRPAPALRIATQWDDSTESDSLLRDNVEGLRKWKWKRKRQCLCRVLYPAPIIIPYSTGQIESSLQADRNPNSNYTVKAPKSSYPEIKVLKFLLLLTPIWRSRTYRPIDGFKTANDPTTFCEQSSPRFSRRSASIQFAASSDTLVTHDFRLLLARLYRDLIE